MGFISEFNSLYRSLSLDVKNDITQNLKEKNIASKAIKKIFEYMQKALKTKPNKTEMQTYKNLIIGHLEMFQIAVRRDKDYSFTLFKEFGKADEFMELLL